MPGPEAIPTGPRAARIPRAALAEGMTTCCYFNVDYTLEWGVLLKIFGFNFRVPYVLNPKHVLFGKQTGLVFRAPGLDSRHVKSCKNLAALRRLVKNQTLAALLRNPINPKRLRI